ncbi:DegT/DnrJ/EryC1/StrS family aminotransferase [Sinorhizobium meliloti]|uniref:DegT/DnrJ/EryC1/StrS family aminotransferase n=1 Tax=Rhizobium meliloti TaxID=382 RepID=UPI001F169374|nr:DegT/DnrJ/EryC1/StrS family aminotransferase [Sinorhizobium meliloti]
MAAAITPDVKAIIVVHMHGISCDMYEIICHAREQGIAVIENCAQAHGALYNGQTCWASVRHRLLQHAKS